MLFKPEMIKQILAGRKTMTRRLVKENEYEDCFDDNLVFVAKGNLSKYKIKWQVGRKYAVCPGRGKSQVWYCPKCKKIVNKNENNWNYSKRRDLFKPIPFNYCGGEVIFKFPSVKYKYNPCGGKLERLFVEVTGIRKEKLLDISEEDAKQEGFKDRAEFLNAFVRINGKLNMTKTEVWVISFKVVE